METNIDANSVMQHLTNRIAQLAFDLAVKDSQIQALQKEINAETNTEPVPSE